MAREEYEVVNGPSNFDLLFALFGESTKILTFETHEGYRHEIEIDGMTRLHGFGRDNITWAIQGVKRTNYGANSISIKYRSDTRKGTLSFDGGEFKKAMDKNIKARALMIVIEKIVAQYQNFQSEHGYEQDEKFFELFNTAKGVHYAKDPKSLNSAIEKI